MTVRAPREWEGLPFVSPERILVGLREIAATYPLHELKYEASSLRTRELRKFGEGRQAALFCHGMSHAIGAPVAFAHVEERDHDIVARFHKNGATNYVPIQLKEWVPEFLNPSSTLQHEIDKLAKYVNGSDLVVAFHLNRDVKVQLSSLSFPRGCVAEIWFYGSLDPSQSRWVIIGNMLGETAGHYEFAYPTTA